jgi:dTDP-4-dehydrorhamnose reductase
MKVLVTGASGQLGRALAQTKPQQIELIALTREQCDLRTAEQCERAVLANRPQVVINAAAYTQVDRAETESTTAFAINAEAPGVLAAAAAGIGARVVQLSTDFVFDGASGRPYVPDAATNPLSVYGASKLAGEQRVAAATDGAAVIVRTAWVYAAVGANFVNTMLRLLATRDEIGVVCDQIGTPTWARSLAAAVWQAALQADLRGVLHWTDAGVASWYDFAVAIQEEARSRGLLSRDARIKAIGSAEYPTAARRPAFSVLDKRSTVAQLHMAPAHWRSNLRMMLDELVR